MEQRDTVHHPQIVRVTDTKGENHLLNTLHIVQIHPENTTECEIRMVNGDVVKVPREQVLILLKAIGSLADCGEFK